MRFHGLYVLLLAAAAVLLSACGGSDTELADVSTEAEVIVESAATTEPTTAPVPTTTDAVEAATDEAAVAPTAMPEIDPVEMQLGMLAGMFGFELTDAEIACVKSEVDPNVIDPENGLVDVVPALDTCVPDRESRMASSLIGSLFLAEDGFTDADRSCMVGSPFGEALANPTENPGADDDAVFAQLLSDSVASCGLFGRVAALEGLVPADAVACVDQSAQANPPTGDPSDPAVLAAYLEAC